MHGPLPMPKICKMVVIFNSFNQKPDNGRYNTEHQWKSIRPGEFYNELTFEIWHQSVIYFLWKYIEAKSDQTNG